MVSTRASQRKEGVIKANVASDPQQRAPTALQLLQHEQNVQSRRERSSIAIDSYGALCRRTEMVDIVDLSPFVSILRDLEKSMGITEVYFRQIKGIIGENDDRDLSHIRGVFTSSQRRDVNKVPCTKKKSISWAKRYGRFIIRQSTAKEQKVCYIYIDGLGRVVVVHLLNAFSEEEVQSRLTFLQDHSNSGWNKGCSLSGHINSDQALRQFKVNPVALEAYFGGYYREYRPLFIDVTEDGRGTSGRLRYINRNGEQKSMQFGNYVRRHVYGDKVSERPALANNKYHQKACSILRVLGHYVFDPKHLLKKEPASTFRMAINHWTGGDSAPPAWHRDGQVHAACLSSAMPSVDSAPLDSVKNANCNSGGLCLEYGGFIYPYGHRDAIIFKGSDLHSPTCPSPNELNTNGENTRVGRHSFVTFIKKKKKKRKYN